MRRLDAVLTLLRASPRWSIFTNAAAVSLGFLIGFVPATVDEVGEQEQVSVQADQAMRESQALRSVYDLSHASLKAHQAAVKRYQQDLAGRDVNAQIPDDQIRAGLAETTVARHSIAVSVGAMQGMTVSDPIVSRAVEKLATATGKLDRNMEALQDLYVALLTGDRAAASKGRAELRAVVNRNDATAVELAAAFISFDSAAKAWIESRSVSVGHATGKARMFAARIGLALLAACVLAAFVIAVAVAVWRRPKEASPIIIARS